MAGKTLNRNDVAALATRMDRQSISINIPHKLAEDLRLGAIALRHALGMKAFDEPFTTKDGTEIVKKAN